MKNRLNLKNQRGYTLIELITVGAIAVGSIVAGCFAFAVAFAVVHFIVKFW
jgi:Tfp pilus assembly protein PilE